MNASAKKTAILVIAQPRRPGDHGGDARRELVAIEIEHERIAIDRGGDGHRSLQIAWPNVDALTAT